MVDALAEDAEEGRSRLRKASGSCQTSFDPGMSEWGNPLEPRRTRKSEIRISKSETN